MTRYSYDDRYTALRKRKVAYNLEKQEICGTLNGDDLAIILPPEERREVVSAISGSGVPITDVIMTGVEIRSTEQNAAPLTFLCCLGYFLTVAGRSSGCNRR